MNRIYCSGLVFVVVFRFYFTPGNLCNKCPKWLVEQNSSYGDYFNVISGFTSNSRAPGGPVTYTLGPGTPQGLGSPPGRTRNPPGPGSCQDSFNATLAAHLCDNETCQFGGVCNVVAYTSSHYVCICPQGYAGIHCETPVSQNCSSLSYTFSRNLSIAVYDENQVNLDVDSEDECKTACLLNNSCKSADYHDDWGSCLLHTRLDHEPTALVYSSNDTVHLVRDCLTGLISSEDNVTDDSLSTCSRVRTAVQGMIVVSLPSPPIPAALSASHTLSVTTDQNVHCADDISVVYVSSSEPCIVVKTCPLLETTQVQTVYSECLFNCTCATRNCEIRVACKDCGDSSVSVCTVESKGFEFTSSSSIP